MDSDKLLKILSISPLPLSTRELSVRLRLQDCQLPDYKIGAILRELSNQGRISLKEGRWVAIHRASVTGLPTSLPQLSTEPASIPAWKADESDLDSIRATAETKDAIQIDTPDKYNGKWGTFRKLVSYYRQCVSQEEGADASAFQNESCKTFFYIRRIGHWYPRPGLRWQSIIPVGSHLSPFLNSLPTERSDRDLVVGYPIQAYYKEREGEPSLAVIRPIFFFKVEAALAQNGLVVTCQDSRPEINLGWLDFAFSQNIERQRNFLAACGFLNRTRPIDEPPGLESGEVAPGINTLAIALSVFMPNKIHEPLHIESIPDHILREPFETGIYNRAVIMLAKRTKYTATLLRELAIIERASDEMLDRTALRHFFIEKPEQPKAEELLHEGIVADVASLNAEQRRATASLLLRDVTLITGPPGTGKSQVVSSTIANARLRSQSVLFASRNHKAIDAVLNRLSGPDRRPLVIRTNSRDDPYLSYTFAHAIRDMLAAQPNPRASERFKNAFGELVSMLDERGKKAALARKVSEAGIDLGRIEERKSFLACKIPKGMIGFIDANPGPFPRRSLQKVLSFLKLDSLGPHSYYRKIFRFFGFITLLPWYEVARRALSRIPQAPQLPLVLSPRAFNKLSGFSASFALLRKASEYEQLNRSCQPLEEVIAGLPRPEIIAEDVSELSRRIEGISVQALELDLDSRCNLGTDVNREKLDGLRAALNAMRTGLDDATIRLETMRVIMEEGSNVLKAFPCWAVTNLSAGSRIPLVPALFDLAIIDEASQSDIPSAIPILFRARRAGAIGDPFQLSHTSRLSTSKDTMLRNKVGLKRVEDVRFAYTESSLYNLFSGTNGIDPVFLNETYRSVAGIADYSSFTFYGGRLRVATDEGSLPHPIGFAKGINWTHVDGEIQTGGGSGCICRKEIEAVLQIMRNLLLENRFRGTVGVVTPFRQQANRLRDALFESDSNLYEAIQGAKVNIDTAHGFQGDERDVIIFSLCAGPGMPAGSLSFLRETGFLFNVAVSRARAVLHVVGNQEWGRRCGIRHIENLATQRLSPEVPQNGPWYPHESPWEQILYNALLEVGLKPRVQFPVLGRRLDMALIRDGDHPIKIDIEVDGDCHRSPDGTRKIDDLWRDIQLQGIGWKVMRFWTYRLREEIGTCVEEILKAWREP